MAEENDQNAVQPQNDEQQTVPMPPVDAEQTQTYAGESYAAESATEPIDVQGGIADQSTAAMPVANDGASEKSAAAADDTPDYASAAGERTVVDGSAQDAPTQQYRPAPEYGAYGPGTDAAGWWHRLRERYCEWRCEWRAEHASAATVWRIRAGFRTAAAAASQSFLRQSVCGRKSAERSAERAIE